VSKNYGIKCCGIGNILGNTLIAWEHLGDIVEPCGNAKIHIISGTHHNTHPPTQEKIPNSTVLFEPSH
jgi:hypothetical protein